MFGMLRALVNMVGLCMGGGLMHGGGGSCMGGGGLMHGGRLILGELIVSSIVRF